jgi:hypothetical protein
MADLKVFSSTEYGASSGLFLGDIVGLAEIRFRL